MLGKMGEKPARKAASLASPSSVLFVFLSSFMRDRSLLYRSSLHNARQGHKVDMR